MKRDKLIISAGLAILAVAALLTAASATKTTISDNRPNSGSDSTTPALAWELKDVDGKLVKSSSFAGKVVILDFWATWCGPCRMEIPEFVELQRKYADKGLAVVGVSLDQGGASAVKGFMTRTGVNYPVVLADEAVVSAFGGVEAIPTTFVIDRRGRIVGKHIGYTEKSEFEAEIKSLLKP